MVLGTPGFQDTTNLTFQLFVCPDSVSPPTGLNNSTAVIIALSIGGGLVLIGVIVLVILCIRRKHRKKLHDNSK